MRMRYKPYARPELAAWSRHIEKPAELKGSWAQHFSNPDLPLHLELGCGKGGFIAQKAAADEHTNYIAVDIKSEVLVVAKRSIESSFNKINKLPNNILITNQNIEKISEIIDRSDNISRIYINFCNPWYKAGHAKHRLTHPRQLIQYRRFLKQGAEIYFKTDDDPLFEDSLRYFELCAFETTWKSENLHKNEPEWNVRTEHEQMFADEGIKIKACIAKMQAAELDEEQIAKWRTI